MYRRIVVVIVVVIVVGLFSVFMTQSCGVRYSLTGGKIPDNMKTYTVDFFENLSAMVYPTLSQNLTEGLKERIRTQSRLSQTGQDGDAYFEGTITNYTITSAGVEAATNMAALNRLSITVKVSYTNRKDDTGDSNFEESFTQFKEFKGDVAAQEEQLNKEIIQLLTEAIFNRAFNNW